MLLSRPAKHMVWEQMPISHMNPYELLHRAIQYNRIQNTKFHAEACGSGIFREAGSCSIITGCDGTPPGAAYVIMGAAESRIDIARE